MKNIQCGIISCSFNFPGLSFVGFIIGRFECTTSAPVSNLPRHLVGRPLCPISGLIPTFWMIEFLATNPIGMASSTPQIPFTQIHIFFLLLRCGQHQLGSVHLVLLLGRLLLLVQPPGLQNKPKAVAGEVVNSISEKNKHRIENYHCIFSGSIFTGKRFPFTCHYFYYR